MSSQLPEYVIDGLHNFLRVEVSGNNAKLTVHSGEYAEVSVAKLKKLLRENGLKAVPPQVASALNRNPLAAEAMTAILTLATDSQKGKQE